MRDAERFAAIEAENVSLRERLAILEAKAAAPKRPPVRPVDDDIVKITNPQIYGRAMPSQSEFEGLLAVVQRLHPRIVPAFEPNRFGTHANDRRQYLDRFIACFQRLESLWRFDGEALGPKRVDFWIHETLNWLGPRGMPDIDQSHFVAAALSWGDIACSIERAPYDVFIGVCYSGTGAHPASSASWRRVLETGKTRPIIITGQQLYGTPQPRIQQLLIRG
jgi:hypothetical protein